MMQWTWLIVIGISIRLAVDIARYAALRAKRRAEQNPADENEITLVSRSEPAERSQSAATRAQYRELVN
jgi:hypothetical protein